ncbi:hypothetical protein Tco_0951047 [Tanacetum coccineum]|uniref:Uncharacterized protein n=1 Tax=Tanacetum coccineum TaxID=301880 RepID=A0ABQ5DVF2_9ASTR
MMHNLVKNQWCAAHNSTITMKDVKAMNKQQLIEEYGYICRRLEKDRLLSAQYNLFRPKPAITEPPSKRQRVERVSSQPASVPAATTLPADDPDSAGGGSSNPAGSATNLWLLMLSKPVCGCISAPVTDSLLTPTTASMDSDIGSFTAVRMGINDVLFLKVMRKADSSDDGVDVCGNGQSSQMNRIVDPRSESESDDVMENYNSSSSYGEFKDSVYSYAHSDELEDFWRTQDEQDCTQFHPRICRDVVVAGISFRTVQAGLRQAKVYCICFLC